MKLAYTEALKIYGIRVEPITGGYSVILLRPDGEPTENRLDVTEEIIRSKTSPKEIVDATNLYLELNLQQLTLGRVFNKFAETLLDKASGGIFLYKNQINLLGQVYIPFADSPVEDWSFRVNGNPEFGIVVPEGTPQVPDTEEGYAAYTRKVLPFVRVLNVEYLSEDFADISIQLTLDGVDLARPGARIFADAHAGYINKREAFTDANGVARFKARRVDLDPTDDMIVQFGFRFYNDLVDVNILHQ